MLDIIKDTLLDSVKLLPFLFLSYILIEYIEHKSSKKLSNALEKSGKFGPLVGSVLGCIPQCGFSVTASNLFSGRVITLGTLISVFLATSDEAIPVLLSTPSNFLLILKVLAIKFIAGFIIGTIVDIVMRKRNSISSSQIDEHIHSICKNCDCNHGILKSSIKHTFNIFIFVLIIAFVLNITIEVIGEDNLSKVLMTGSVFEPFIAALIGLIPNCASSVLLTQLHMAGNLSFSAMVAGLCSGAGIGLAVLFKSNKNLKENLFILLTVYLSGAFVGVLINFLRVIFL